MKKNTAAHHDWLELTPLSQTDLSALANHYAYEVHNGVATFDNIDVFQGTFLRKQFVVDGSLDQRFLLDNSFIDSSTIELFEIPGSILYLFEGYQL